MAHRIEAVAEPFQGYQMVRAYRYAQSADGPGEAVNVIRARALMIPPGIPDFMTRERLVNAGPHDPRRRPAAVPLDQCRRDPARSALDEHVPPVCTSALVNSILQAVSHAVGRQAACSHDSPSGLATTLCAARRRPRPGCRRGLAEQAAAGSSVSSPVQPGEATTAWTSTSLPSASTPAPSQPSTMGSRWPAGPPRATTTRRGR